MSEQEAMERLSSIDRIRSVTVQDFRGLVGEHRFDTDADIVLLAGPNGHGKSSLIEAMLLLLTDHDYHLHGAGMHCGAKTLFSSVDGSLRPAFSIEAVVNEEEQRGLSLKCEREESDTNDQSARLDPCAARREDWLSEAAAMRPELAARLCTFFQDRVKELFDETTDGTTLRNVLEPVPHEITWYLEDVEELKKKLSEAEERILGSPPGDPETIRQRLTQSLGFFRPTYEKIRMDRRKWPHWPQRMDSDFDEKVFSSFAVEVLAAEGYGIEPGSSELPRLFSEALEQTVKELVQNVAKKADSDKAALLVIEKEISGIDRDLDAIADRYPNLDEEVTAFEAGRSEEPDLLSIFRALARNRDRWATIGTGKAQSVNDELKRVLEEVRAVVSSEAWQCAVMLEEWLDPRREVFRKKTALQQKREQLELKRERARESDRLSRLRELQKRLKPEIADVEAAWKEERGYSAWVEKASLRDAAGAQLKAARDAVQWLSNRLRDLSRGSPELKALLQRMLNAVVHRFNFVEGVYPLEVIDPESEADAGGSAQERRSYEIRTRDGRTLKHLSTGQFAQIAVSLLVAQNQVLSRHIPHRILLLDDVSTAYDLSNLTREAILWRQLAYAARSGGKPGYQIFISTHHEDLMSHMVDLLVPPKGRKMHIIRFLSWRRESGPHCHHFRVFPSGGKVGTGNGENAGKDRTDGLEAVRENLRRALEEALW